MLLVLVAVIGVAAVGAGLGVRAILVSHQSPPGLSLSTTQPGGSPSELQGKWIVGPGSEAGYRVKEKFINQETETEAVARTPKVTGTLAVAISNGAVTVTQMKFSVDLTSLQSQDRYANYQVYQRDFFVRRIYLQTDVYPTATFNADMVRFAEPANGRVSVDVSGKLTVHGSSRPVIAHVEAQATGAQGEVAGSIDVDMRDFGIDPPDISFTRSEPGVTIEYHLVMVRA